MISEEKMREEFEAWCVKEIELPEGYDLNWSNDTVRLMYRGWVASRESLVIELPGHNPEYIGDRDHQQWACGCNYGINSCREAIHAAGVKTK